MARGAIWWPEATPLHAFLPCGQLEGVEDNLVWSSMCQVSLSAFNKHPLCAGPCT